MSILCLFGRHDWKEVVRVHPKPIKKEMRILVVPSLFAGPPFMAPTGIYYDEKYTVVAKVCRRCNTRRSA